MQKHRTFQWRLATVCLVLLCGWTAVAQTQFGTIYGRVTDKTGAVVSDATVTLTNIGKQTSQEVKTSGEGSYTVGNIAAGDYKIVVAKEGFSKVEKKLAVTVAERLTEDFALQVGSASESVTVEASSVQVNTTSGDVAHTVTTKDLENLPLLTKNPYALIGLAAGAVDTAAGTGDARGTGFAVSGQRTSSVNYLLDGSENNETFVTGPGALVPNDSVAELRIQSNNMTAEFGRNAVVTNVITKSGTNQFHGSASEYYRGAALTANTVANKANGVPKPNFVRNDFTFTAGGPIIKDRTFFYTALEGVRVRSNGTTLWWVPTDQFLANAGPGMAAYLTAAGGIPTSDPSKCITSLKFRELNSPDPENLIPALKNSNTGAVIADDVPLFCETATSSPIDAGGGTGGNTWNAVGKIDHKFTQNTQLAFRYAFTDIKNPLGAFSVAASDSPFPAFRSDRTFTSANYTTSLTHTFSPNLVSESHIAFSRTEPENPNGKADPRIPCLQFGNRAATLDSNPIVFPGYLPTICNFASLRAGGPQNTISGGTGFTWAKGKHTFKYGASFSHLRDNHVFGAFENGLVAISDPQNLLDGQVDTRFSVAIDPKGKVVGDLYDPAVDGPFVYPNFKRHYRYNEVGFYGEDSIRLTPRFTLTLGMRWEYFGVLHSPQAERSLDANFLLDAVGQPKSANPSKTVFEQIRDGRFQRVNNLFNQDWNNFSPRIGFAWDVFGNGGTSIRGGYGIFYDKNFGNALFNVIQNPPNYNVATVFGNGSDPQGSIDPNQFVVLTNLVGAGAVPIRGSARMLDKDVVTAYSQQWNVGFEHDFLHKGLIGSVTYVATKGDKLYSLNNLNQIGSCILAPEGSLPTCDAGGLGPASRLNQTGVTGLNRRGNEGFSRYQGVEFELKTRAIWGVTLNTSYTYSQWKDNASSFFADSLFDSPQFGFKDPFNPGLDYANSTNDIRNKYVLAYSWDVPIGKGMTGVGKQVLSGWNLSGVVSAQTGGAFSVYDLNNGDSSCAISGTNYCYPLLVGSIPKMTQTPTGQPNQFTLYGNLGNGQGVFQSQSAFCEVDLACTANLYLKNAKSLSPRNLFRLPGYWSYDAALAKRFSIGERIGLELHLEALNIFNHSNLFANATNDISNLSVTGNRGLPPGINAAGVSAERRSLQLGAKLTF
jgi:hypothetical protein